MMPEYWIVLLSLLCGVLYVVVRILRDAPREK
jgi:hypothetical protein